MNTFNDNNDTENIRQPDKVRREILIESEHLRDDEEDELLQIALAESLANYEKERKYEEQLNKILKENERINEEKRIEMFKCQEQLKKMKQENIDKKREMLKDILVILKRITISTQDKDKYQKFTKIIEDFINSNKECFEINPDLVDIFNNFVKELLLRKNIKKESVQFLINQSNFDYDNE